VALGKVSASDDLVIEATESKASWMAVARIRFQSGRKFSMDLGIVEI